MSDLDFLYTVASGGSRSALRRTERDEVVEKDGEEIDLGEYPAPERVMVSYATEKNTLWPGPQWTVDCGGYSTLAGKGSYDSTCQEYVEWLRDQQGRDDVELERFVLRDWACESEVLREYNRGVAEHQRRTLRDHIATHDEAMSHGVDAEPIAVIQGYDLRDYLSFVDDLRDYGLLTDTVGIGSVCRRGQLAEIRNIILRLRDELPSRVSLHGFGVKRSALRDPLVVEALDSVDTAAWENAAYWDAISNASTDGNRYTWPRVLESYGEYRERVDELMADAEAANSDDGGQRVRSLADWGSQDYLDVGCELVKCICGAELNPRDLDGFEPGCRHCERAENAIWNRREVIGGDREVAREVWQSEGAEAQEFRPVAADRRGCPA